MDFDQTTCKEIDICKTEVSKTILNIHWQDKITNVELYRRYKLKPWSEVIKEHRMKWYGHLLRLNEKAPTRLALKKAERKVKKPKGDQKLTWMKLIGKDLDEYKTPRCEAEMLAQDRTAWKKTNFLQNVSTCCCKLFLMMMII